MNKSNNLAKPSKVLVGTGLVMFPFLPKKYKKFIIYFVNFIFFYKINLINITNFFLNKILNLLF